MQPTPISTLVVFRGAAAAVSMSEIKNRSEAMMLREYCAIVLDLNRINAEGLVIEGSCD
jgi:hypothetical protein